MKVSRGKLSSPLFDFSQCHLPIHKTPASHFLPPDPFMSFFNLYALTSRFPQIPPYVFRRRERFFYLFNHPRVFDFFLRNPWMRLIIYGDPFPIMDVSSAFFPQPIRIPTRGSGFLSYLSSQGSEFALTRVFQAVRQAEFFLGYLTVFIQCQLELFLPKATFLFVLPLTLRFYLLLFTPSPGWGFPLFFHSLSSTVGSILASSILYVWPGSICLRLPPPPLVRSFPDSSAGSFLLFRRRPADSSFLLYGFFRYG